MKPKRKKEKTEENRLKRFRLNKDVIIFLLALLITTLVFNKFLTGHYATDSYNLTGIGYIEYLKENFLPGGRVFSAMLYYVAFVLRISYDSLFVLSLLGGLILSNIMFIKLKNICLASKKKWNWLELFVLIIASYYTIFNAMYLENLYFAETLIMSLSVYFYMLAAKIFSDKENEYMIKTILFCVLGVFCYQGTISAFFAFLILFELLKDKKIIEILKKFVLACFPVVIAILINILQIKVACNVLQIEQGRLQLNLISNFVLGLKQVINMFMNTFYRGFHLHLLALIIIVTINFSLKTSKNTMHFLGIMMIVIICLGAAIIPTLSSTSAIYSARIRFSIGSCIGLVYLFLVTKTDIFKDNKFTTLILVTVLFVYGTFNTYNYISNINISKKINIKDVEETKKVISYIEKYEEQNNIEVSYIAIYIDSKNSYKGIYRDLMTDYSVMNWSALRTRWSSKEIIEYYSNRKFKEKKITDEEKEIYIKEVDKDKDYLIIEDTLYITCYIN